MIFQQVVRSDEIGDGFGNGFGDDDGDDDKRNSAHQPPTPATHFQPLPPYYFILTAHNTSHP